MGFGMIGRMALRWLAYLGDGTVWLVSLLWIVTGLYGCSAKKAKGRFALFACIIGADALFRTILSCVQQETDNAYGNSILLLFGYIYWMCQLEEPNKLKRFCSIFVAGELVTGLLNLFGCITSLLFGSGYTGLVGMGIVLLQQGLVLASAFFLAKLSSKNRKEPMQFTMILSTFILCVFLNGILNFLHPLDFEELQPVVALKIVVGEEEINKAMTTVILLFSTVAVFLFLIMLIRESEANYFQKKNTISEYYLEAQKAHYESLMESDRTIRRIKHDMKNHIYCMQELCRNKRYGELEEYLLQVDESFARADKKVQVGNEIADAILSEKLKQAEEKQITLVIDGTMFGVELKAMDICTILANLLDNAIEAVEELPKEQRRIELFLRKNRNFFLIEEQNKTKRKLEVNGNEIATTKKKKESHGFGLMNIREAVSKYDGECNIKVSKEADKDGCYLFQMEMILPMQTLPEEENG